VPVELPESRANPLDQKVEPLDISIDKEGQIFVDGDPITLSALSARLEDVAASQDPANPRQILLRGDTEIEYGTVMRVMGELNRVGLNSVSMVTAGSSKVE
jgi:biopolymer transport protein TolR